MATFVIYCGFNPPRRQKEQCNWTIYYNYWRWYY